MKDPVKLNEKEMHDCVDMQKKMIEIIAQHICGYNNQKSFEITSIAISLVISNMLSSFGINKIDIYLDDMMENIKVMHENVKKHNSYMIYEKGKKVKEGQFN